MKRPARNAPGTETASREISDGQSQSSPKRQRTTTPRTAGSNAKTTGQDAFPGNVPPPPRAPKVDRDYVRALLAVQDATLGISLKAFKQQKRQIRQLQKSGGGKLDLQDTSVGDEKARLTQVQREVTRKPTPPGRNSQPQAHYSNLDDVRGLLAILTSSFDALKSDLDGGLFEKGEGDNKYKCIFNSLWWKKCQLGRQAAILEWMESPHRQQHSVVYSDLLELRLTKPFPFEAYHIRPEVSGTQGMTEAMKRDIRNGFQTNSPEGLSSVIVWLCRQITDLEKCPLHYQPKSKAQQETKTRRYSMASDHR